MKQITLKTAFNLILIGAAALMTACSSIEREVVVVTATPTATPLVITATPEPTPLVTLSVGPAAAGIRPGALVRGNGEAVINVTPVATDLPQAEPAAVVEQSMPQPLFCTEVPIRGFGQLWHDQPEVKTTLGCADSWQGGEQATQTAVQIFQNGVMVWLQADGYYSGDPVYVFFADGTFQRFGELGPADPAKVGSVPAGFYEIGDKFSKVYWEGTGAQVKERLGYAIGPAKDSAGAYQLFSNGRMFWLEEIDRIFVVYEYGYFEGNTYMQVHTWHSYKDTF